MKVSVIIVNHNTGNVLVDCIRSLAKFEKEVNYEIVIIDNFSSDNSRSEIDMLVKENSNITAINTDSLIGFSAANNLGIKASNGEYVLIMNPDIIFTEPVFTRLISYLESHADAGAITPALVGTDGNFQRNYFQRFPSIRQFIFYNSLAAGLFNKSASRMNKYLENQDIDISTGKTYFTEQIPCAFFFTRRSNLADVGLMDESYILFFEDVDLSWNIGKKHKLVVDTSMIVTHLGGSSFKTENNWWLYGRYIISMINFFRLHYSTARLITLKFLVYTNSILIIYFEYIKALLGKKDAYRLSKHKYMLSLMRGEN